MSAISLLFAAHPTPPMGHAPVGKPPLGYLNALPNNAFHIASLHPWAGLLGTSLTRAQVRDISRDSRPTELAKYACIMAWGGQHLGNFHASILNPNLPGLISQLFLSVNTRGFDFDHTKNVCNNINGLGISFYTKLIFFLRAQPDGYILDQWTAKSVSLICHPLVIPLSQLTNGGFLQGHPVATTGDHYRHFCEQLEYTAWALWPMAPFAGGEHTEIAMFDRSEPDGFWRQFVRVNFTNMTAGRLLQAGAESLTQSLDYRNGYLVIRQISSPRIYVIQFDGSCCSWTVEDIHRFLLARLNELKNEHNFPITLVVPPGPCPNWFTEPLINLGVHVIHPDGAVAGDLGKPDNEECDDEVMGPGSDKVDPSQSLPHVINNPEKSRLYLEDGPDNFIKIVGYCGAANDGYICKGGHRSNKIHIWCKNQASSKNVYITGHIRAAGGDFEALPGYVAIPNQEMRPCKGGNQQRGVPTPYVGAREFDTVRHAIHYLKNYFCVLACATNLITNQEFIDAC